MSNLANPSSKSLIKSKTFWVNVLMSASAVGAHIAGGLDKNTAIGAIAFGAVGIILRTITSGEITGVFPKK